MIEPQRCNKSIAVKSSPGIGRVIRFIGSDESVDRDGDTISIDGWDVGNYLKNPVVLYGHDYGSLPVGRAVVTIDRKSRQLLFDVSFPTIEELSSNPDTPSEHALRVDAIYNMAKAGILNTVSVGFMGVDFEPTATGRNYKKQELMEVSIVPVPANPNAVAVLRTAGVTESVIKGVTIMDNTETKGNRRLSKESLSYLAERVDAIERACGDLRKYMADEPNETEPSVNEEEEKTADVDTDGFIEIIEA